MVGAVVVVLAAALGVRVVTTVRRDAALRRRLAPHLVDADTADPTDGVVDRLAGLVAPAAGVARRWAVGIMRRSGVVASLAAPATGTAVGAADVVAVAVVVGPAAAVVVVLAGGGIVVAGIAAVVAAGAPVVVVAVRAARYRRRFAAGLVDVLVLLAGALRAGFPVSAALGAVTAEVDGPVADGFARVAAQTTMGRPLPEALEALAHRMGSDEVAWLAMAIDIHHTAGGNLAEVVDTVAATITERTRLRREVATLTAEGRLSAIVLGVLPPAMGVVIAVVNPAYLASLFSTPTGITLVVAAAVGMLVGFVWMQRIVTIEV